MFGINNVEQAKQIAEGWTNYALGREQELSESRMKICKECPLYNSEKDTCDSKKCWDTEEDKLVDYPGKTVICGCGCYCKKKSRVPSAKCVLDRWPK